MSFKFTPKTENQLREESLAPAGEYDFRVLSAENKISKTSGNPMIELTLGLYRDGEIRWRAIDYLTASMQIKLFHFCAATGIIDIYEKGELSAYLCEGLCGRCKVYIQHDAKNEYPPKNAIKDYMPRSDQVVSEQKTDDDLPF